MIISYSSSSISPHFIPFSHLISDDKAGPGTLILVRVRVRLATRPGSRTKVPHVLNGSQEIFHFYFYARNPFVLAHHPRRPADFVLQTLCRIVASRPSTSDWLIDSPPGGGPTRILDRPLDHLSFHPPLVHRTTPSPALSPFFSSIHSFGGHPLLLFLGSVQSSPPPSFAVLC